MICINISVIHQIPEPVKLGEEKCEICVPYFVVCLLLLLFFFVKQHKSVYV